MLPHLQYHKNKVAIIWQEIPKSTDIEIIDPLGNFAAIGSSTFWPHESLFADYRIRHIVDRLANMASASPHYNPDDEEHFSDSALFVPHVESGSTNGMTSGQQNPEVSKGKKRVGWSLPSSEVEDEDGNEPRLDELRRMVRQHSLELSHAHTSMCGLIHFRASCVYYGGMGLVPDLSSAGLSYVKKSPSLNIQSRLP